MNHKTLIEKLLAIISMYDNNDVSKEAILHTKSINNQVVIYRLVTKGDSGKKGSPFFTSAMNTCVIEEFYVDGEVVYANMLYSER